MHSPVRAWFTREVYQYANFRLSNTYIGSAKTKGRLVGTTPCSRIHSGMEVGDGGIGDGGSLEVTLRETTVSFVA